MLPVLFTFAGNRLVGVSASLLPFLLDGRLYQAALNQRTLLVRYNLIGDFLGGCEDAIQDRVSILEGPILPFDKLEVLRQSLTRIPRACHQREDDADEVGV